METKHDAGSAPQSGNQETRVSRRSILRGAVAVAGAATTGGTEGLASLGAPGAVEGVATIGGVAELLSAARQVCSGVISRNAGYLFCSLGAESSSEVLESAVVGCLSERVAEHFLMLKEVQDALVRLESSHQGPRAVEELRRDSAALTQAWQQRRNTMVQGAIELLQESWIIRGVEGVKVGYGPNPLTNGDVGGDFHGLLVAVSREERDWMMTQLSAEWLREYIHEFDFFLERGTNITDILEWALAEEDYRKCTGKDPETKPKEVREYEILERELGEKYRLRGRDVRVVDALFRGLSNPLGRHSPVDFRSENDYLAELPRLAHSGFLSLRTDVLDLFREEFAPQGVWQSPAYQETYRRLSDSLDITIKGLAEELMKKHFPEYMAAESPCRKDVEQELSRRKDCAVEKRRVAEVERTNFAWPGLEGPGNDYY